MAEPLSLTIEELAALLSARNGPAAEEQAVPSVARGLVDKGVLEESVDAKGTLEPSAAFVDVVRVLADPQTILRVTNVSIDGDVDLLLFLDPISVVEARLEEDSVTVASFPTEDVVDRLSPLIPLPKSGTSRSAQGSLSEIVAEIFGDDPGKPGVAVLEATTTYGDLEVFDEHVWLFDGDGNCWTLEENDSESQEFTASPVDRRTIVDSVLDTLPA